MKKIVDILEATTVQSAFRNFALVGGTLWIAAWTTDGGMKVAALALLTAVVQSWSSFDKLTASQEP